MKPTLTIGNAVVYHGSNLDVLPTLPDNSVDSIVTDPPYELGFMGKKWDSTGIAYSVELWTECMRVLKPGGHLLAFGGSRTWHRLAVAIEDAGFEVRDSIAWLYGSGFPKSMDIAKAIDKASGYQGEVLGTETIDVGMQGGSMHAGRDRQLATREIKELSDEAKQWSGWGTALKPAFEPVVVARKPLIGTVAENVLTWGVGGLNIDDSRIGFANEADRKESTAKNQHADFGTAPMTGNTTYGDYSMVEPKNYNPPGRWPANIILDEYTAGLLDEQSGVTHGRIGMKKNPSRSNAFTQEKTDAAAGMFAGRNGGSVMNSGVADLGGASRFFYVAKASKRDRNEGLNGLPIRRPDERTETGMGTFAEKGVQPQRNFHPTVKPTDLMRYLVKLVTPPNGTVLDPFTGSGSTGKAALLEGCSFIGIELTEEYLPIIEGRLTHASQAKEEKESETLF